MHHRKTWLTEHNSTFDKDPDPKVEPITWTNERLRKINSDVAAEAMGALYHKIRLLETSKSIGTPLTEE